MEETSPLIRLAPELRNKIFALAIPDNKHGRRRIPIEMNLKTGKLHTTPAIAKGRPTAVIQVCRQLRHEYSKLVYARHSTFAIRYFDIHKSAEVQARSDAARDELAAFRRFKANLGPVLFGLVKDVKVTITRSDLESVWTEMVLRQQSFGLINEAKSHPSCQMTLKFRLKYEFSPSLQGDLLGVAGIKQSFDLSSALLSGALEVARAKYEAVATRERDLMQLMVTHLEAVFEQEEWVTATRYSTSSLMQRLMEALLAN